MHKLEASIAELKTIFEEDYSKLPRFTLVALDPNIQETEPVLLEVEEIVIKHSETLRSKYPDMPRNILRGVILNALNGIGKEDPTAARIIYLTGSNFFSYSKLGSEKDLIENLIKDLGDIAEEKAVEEWSLIETEP